LEEIVECDLFPNNESISSTNPARSINIPAGNNINKSTKQTKITTKGLALIYGV
jgi:hypothetical protein